MHPHKHTGFSCWIESIDGLYDGFQDVRQHNRPDFYLLSHCCCGEKWRGQGGRIVSPAHVLIRLGRPIEFRLMTGETPPDAGSSPSGISTLIPRDDFIGRMTSLAEVIEEAEYGAARFGLEARNLGDENIEEFNGFPTPDFSLFATLTYRFEL